MCGSCTTWLAGRQPKSGAKPCRASMRACQGSRAWEEHMVDPGRQPSYTVYPLQDKLSASPILSAAVVFLIKRSFYGKTAVLIFWVGLSSRFSHSGQDLSLAPTPCCSLQSHRFPHCQQPVAHLPTTLRPGHPGIGTCASNRHQRHFLSLVLNPEIIILMNSKWY